MTQTPLTTDGEKRREQGRALFTKLLSYMLKDVSHPEMSALADWALDETGCLHTSQLSHLRNAKMRMLGVKSLDALGRINVAADLFKRGERKELKALGTAQTTARIEEVLERYEPIMNNDGVAMDAGDLMMVYLGYIHLDLFEGEQEGKDWTKAAENLTAWIETLLEERGIRTREALAIIKREWPGTDDSRDKFCLVVAGVEDLTADELPDLWASIAVALRPIVDEDYTEQDLLDMVVA